MRATLAFNGLTQLLTAAVNKSIEENIFPDHAKIASVVPLDNGKPNKNEVRNFRSVSVLDTFSKIYEKVIKKQLVEFMEQYFSSLIFFGPKTWNTPLYHKNSVENLVSLKAMIKFWNDETCCCKICCKK